MAYRSERFPAGELKGLDKAWQIVDGLEESGLPVVSEVMSGTSYRRQLDERTAAKIGAVDYVLQAVLSVPNRDDDKRISAHYFIDESRRILGGIDPPGEGAIDEGGLNGHDPDLGNFAFGSTGRTKDDVLTVYPPWINSRWTEVGKSCMFYCGIKAPLPKALMEDYPVRWDERIMRQGAVVFEPTPADLRAY